MSFRTAGARTDLQNEVEFARVPRWFVFIVAIVSGLFFVVTLFVWFDLISAVYRRTSGNELYFVALLGGMGLTFGVPFVAYAYGYATAKAIEYNRSLDSIQLIGTLGTELGNKTFSDAMQLGIKAGQGNEAAMIAQIDELNNLSIEDGRQIEVLKAQLAMAQKEVNELREHARPDAIDRVAGGDLG